jgi:hypothetical protein
MANIPVEYYNTQNSGPKDIKSKWWKAQDELMYESIFGVVERIDQAQSYRTVNNVRFARLYQNMELIGLDAGQFARSSDNQTFIQNRVTYNVVKSCIDTAAAKIAKNKPRPFFMTDGGNWDMQRRALRLNKYMEGLFDSIGTGDGDNRTLYGMGRRSFVDSCISGLGATKFFVEGDTVKAERVISQEIVVDDIEGRYEQPRQLFQKKLVFREILADAYPEFREKIIAVPSGIKKDQDGLSSADMITVIEAWHLPSSEDSDDGKKVIAIENCTLRVDDWKKDYFPFVFQRWSPRQLGFYGCGLAEELIGIQLEINKWLRNIQISQHLMSSPQVWLEYASKVVSKHINNEKGGIKYYAGKPPIFLVPQAMSAEIYQHLETLYNKAFQITGISQLSATSKKPSGVDAAVALRELQDIESERFQLVGQRYEDSFMDATRICLDLLDDIAATGANPAVRIREGEKSFVAKWKDCRLPKDQYTLRPFPTALLPSTPAGKFAKVQEMMQAGFWTKEESMDLLDMPDIKMVISLKTAQRRDLKRMIEKMVDDGEYTPPEPFINLEMARDLAQSYYLYGRSEGMPEDRLELLLRFMEDVQAMLMPPAPPQVMPPMAEAALPPVDAAAPPPMAQPAAQPVSDLLPVGGV